MPRRVPSGTMENGWLSACGRHRCMNDRRARTTRFRRRETPSDEQSGAPTDLWHDLASARDAFDREVSPPRVNPSTAHASAPYPAGGEPRGRLTRQDRSWSGAPAAPPRPTRQWLVAGDRDPGRPGVPEAPGERDSSRVARDRRTREPGPLAPAPFSRRDERLASSGQWAAAPLGGVARARPAPGRVRWPRIAAMVAGVVVGWQVLTGLAMPAPPPPPPATPPATPAATQVGGQSGASVPDTALTWVTSTPAGASGRDPAGARETASEPAGASGAATAATAVVRPTTVPIAPTRIPPTATRVPPTRIPSTPTAVPPSRTPSPAFRPRAMTVTAYCLRSSTSSGAQPGPGTAAAGPMVALGSRFRVPGYGDVVVRDRNATYGPDQLDVWLADCNQAIQWGRRTLDVTPEQ